MGLLGRAVRENLSWNPVPLSGDEQATRTTYLLWLAEPRLDQAVILRCGW